MSGHSKWATTKRAKEGKDAKRSGLFTKLAKAISIAARDGGDPEMNFKLRMAIDRAKKLSLPKDNIDRAIKSGTGENGGAIIEEITYEGYGPGGIALIIETITDNKNRTVGEVKHMLSKYGGNLGGSGSVMWMFDRKGVIYLESSSINEEQELIIIDAGAEDIITDDNSVIIYTLDSDLHKIKEQLEKNGFDISDSKLEFVPKDKAAVESEEKVLRILDALDDLDDVQNIYTNADI
ncbi:YebC/PmpR family DNA-binding transcriptional regulator [Patescibacteria group bacterium]|nr:YebC/PmpR family DNA-binding transcriptional regulator [Patescibacteria group bacterium]